MRGSRGVPAEGARSPQSCHDHKVSCNERAWDQSRQGRRISHEEIHRATSSTGQSPTSGACSAADCGRLGDRPRVFKRRDAGVLESHDVFCGASSAGQWTNRSRVATNGLHRAECSSTLPVIQSARPEAVLQADPPIVGVSESSVPQRLGLPGGATTESRQAKTKISSSRRRSRCDKASKAKTQEETEGGRQGRSGGPVSSRQVKSQFAAPVADLPRKGLCVRGSFCFPGSIVADSSEGALADDLTGHQGFISSSAFDHPVHTDNGGGPHSPPGVFKITELVADVVAGLLCSRTGLSHFCQKSLQELASTVQPASEPALWPVPPPQVAMLDGLQQSKSSETCTTCSFEISAPAGATSDLCTELGSTRASCSPTCECKSRCLYESCPTQGG